MTSRLQSRLERIERQAAPIMELIRERRAKIKHFRATVKLDDSLDAALAGYRYIGREASREQVASDLLELMGLTIAEHHKRHGRWFANNSEIEAAMTRATMLLLRESYGREMSEDEAESEIDTWGQMEKDMHAGIPVADSEAAQYFINLDAQYPRLKTRSDRMNDYLYGAKL
jgi:hypothetical protein